jgi:hypothetical protein
LEGIYQHYKLKKNTRKNSRQGAEAQRSARTNMISHPILGFFDLLKKNKQEKSA